MLAQHFAGRSGDTVTVVWKASAGAQAPQARARVQRFLAAAQRVEGIGSAGPIRVAPDRTIATTDARARPPRVGPARRHRYEAHRPRPAGEWRRADRRARRRARSAWRRAAAGREGFGLLGAAIVLLIAFGSIVAAGLPLVIALFGLGISASLIGVLAAVMRGAGLRSRRSPGCSASAWASTTRCSCSRAFAPGWTPAPACRTRSSRPPATAGRSVLVAGTTVLISVLGLFLMGVGYLQGVAVSASLAVLVVMAAAVTLLPALLSYAGPRVNRLHIPGLGRALRGDGPTPALRWSRMIQRRPWTAALVGAAIVLALAAPVLGLRLGFPDEGNDQAGSMTRAAYDLTVEGFGPGANGPLLLVAQLPRGEGAQALDPLVRAARADRDVAYVSAPQRSPDGRAAVITVAPRSPRSRRRRRAWCSACATASCPAPSRAAA